LILLLLVPMVAVPPRARAATPQAQAQAQAQDIHQQNLDAYLRYIEDHNAGRGSVSVFRQGQPIYMRSFGQPQDAVPAPSPDTPYPIASVTKMITAILTFRLIERNDLHLEDKLSTYVENIPQGETITIGQMLQHTSGLGNFAIRNGAIWVIEPVSQAQILQEIRRQGVAFAPGSRTAYSNSAYYLLRLVLEQKYGRPYHQIVQEEIATPLGLKHFTAALATQGATFTSHTFVGHWQPIKDIDYRNVIGVGDIASTTNDLNTVVSALFQHRLLRAETVAMMLPVGGHDGWGMGLAAFPIGQHAFLGHGGDVLGAHARVVYNPADGIAIAYATNGERIATNTFLETIVGIVYGAPLRMPTLK